MALVTDWKPYHPYFTESEFVCKCKSCQKVGKAYVDKEFLDMLLKARLKAGVAFHINSGGRCPLHNIESKGKTKSDHIMHIETNTFCRGVDIKVTDSRTRFLILEALIESGFVRIGIYNSFIHAGNNKSNPQNIIWVG